MASTKSSQPLLPTARKVAQRLLDAGHETYFAGGAVRDGLLGRPVKDVDIATAALPAQVGALFPKARKVGAAFGVMLVRQAGHFFEIATFRSDGSYSDGRRPDAVTFGSLEDDARRRDFSINGLYQHPQSDAIIDLVGGRRDLEDRVLRAIGDPRERFGEDHLRLLRAVRFACRFSLDLEPATARALRALAPKVAGVAAERVLAELERCWLGADPARALALLSRLGLLEALLPEVAAAPGWGERVASLGAWARLDERTPAEGWGLVLDGLCPLDVARRDEISAAMAERALARLRASNRLRADVSGLIDGVARMRAFATLGRPARRRLFRAPLGPTILRLAALRARVEERCFGPVRAWRRELEALPRTALFPPKLIDGRKLAARGYPRGPRLATILRAVEDAQLAGELDAAGLDGFLAAHFPLGEQP